MEEPAREPKKFSDLTPSEQLLQYKQFVQIVIEFFIQENKKKEAAMERRRKFEYLFAVESYRAN
jgi:hypothetical protein